MKLLSKNSLPNSSGWLAIAFLYFLAYSLLIYFLYQKYYLAEFDYGIYAYIVWKISQGLGSYNDFLPNFMMADHFHPIIYCYALLYKIWPSHWILPLSSIIFVCSSAYPVFQLARGRGASQILAAGITFAYLGFYGYKFSFGFSWHPSDLMAPSFLWLIYLSVKNSGWAWLFFIIPLLCKENAGFYLLFIGAYLYFFHKKPTGLLIGLAGFMAFLLINFFVMPQLQQNSLPANSISNFYSYLGSNPLEITVNIFIKPHSWLFRLFDDPAKVRVVFYTLASSGFLAVVSPALWMLMIPQFFDRFLSTNSLHWQYIFHYGSMMSVAFSIGLIDALPLWRSWLKILRERFDLIMTVLLLIATLTVAYRLEAPLTKIVNPGFYNVDQTSQELSRYLKEVKGEKKITVHQSIVPHLHQRTNVFVFPASASDADLVILRNGRDFWPLDSPERFKEAVAKLIKSGHFRVKMSHLNYLVLARDEKMVYTLEANMAKLSDEWQTFLSDQL